VFSKGIAEESQDPPRGVSTAIACIGALQSGFRVELVDKYFFEGARLCGVPGKPVFGLLGCLEPRRPKPVMARALAPEETLVSSRAN
jgi:hypothetical protein